MVNALIVLYNKKIDEAITYKCLINCDKIHLIIFDNTVDNSYNKKYAKEHSIEYYSKGQNLGLSKAYNMAIEKSKIKSDHYIMILDDDTELNDKYLDEVLKVASLKKYDVLLPVVKSSNRLLSPSVIQFDCRVKMVTDISKLNMNKITAINSGMVVRRSVFDDIKYDENLFLDYVDHMFMRDVRKNKKTIYILNSAINQNYSRDQKQSVESVRFRFNIFKKDFKYYCKECNRMFFYYVSTLKLKMVYFLKYKKNI